MQIYFSPIFLKKQNLVSLSIFAIAACYICNLCLTIFCFFKRIFGQKYICTWYKKRKLLLPLLLVCGVLSARPLTTTVHSSADSVIFVPSESTFEINSQNSERPSPIIRMLRTKHQRSKKLIAAVLAFPLPFGIVGLHRIYLGSAPYVPVAYIASLGGVFGVLPFIDFCVILAAKKTDSWVNNDKIFMWVN